MSHTKMVMKRTTIKTPEHPCVSQVIIHSMKICFQTNIKILTRAPKVPYSSS